MTLRVVPRESVSIDSSEADENDLLEVVTADGKTYYVAATQGNWQLERASWPANLVEDVRTTARGNAAARGLRGYRDMNEATEASMNGFKLMLDSAPDIGQYLSGRFCSSSIIYSSWTIPSHIVTICATTRDQVRELSPAS